MQAAEQRCRRGDARGASARRAGRRQHRAPDAAADHPGKGPSRGRQPPRGGLPAPARGGQGRSGGMTAAVDNIAVAASGIRHFLDLSDFEPAVLRGILDHAARMKAGRKGKPKGAVEPDRPAADRILAMIFEKPSTRTRLSFDSAMRQLGGETIVLRADDLQIGRGETVADTPRILSATVDDIQMRTGKTKNLMELAANEIGRAHV